MIRIVHTADWHLGKRLRQQSLIEEQQLFLDWMIHQCNTLQIDYLLMSGDLFDVANPPQEATAMYYEFLAKLVKNTTTKAIITGGNHDSIGTLNGIRPLTDFMNVHILGEPYPDYPEKECIELFNKEGHIEAILAATPFLREKDFRFIESPSEDPELRLADAHRNHYKKLATFIQNKYPETMALAMGHLFVSNSMISPDSERMVGTLNGLPLNIFPELFKYVALGHIHKPQEPQKNRIIYSGSPNMLSFSETEYAKRIVLLEIGENQISNLQSIEIPIFRKLIQITGTLSEIENQLINFELPAGLTPWLKIIAFQPKEDAHDLPKLFHLIQEFNLTWEGKATIVDQSLKYIHSSTASSFATIQGTADHITPSYLFEQLFPESQYEHLEKIQELFQKCLTELEQSGEEEMKS
jgi:exonuclease SbcD